MSVRKDRVEVRILRPGAETAAIIKEFETWFIADGEDLVFRCPTTGIARVDDQLGSVDQQLKWLHGMLEFKRKFIRQLEERGVLTVVKIYVIGRVLKIEPESLYLPHHLHLRTEIHLSS